MAEDIQAKQRRAALALAQRALEYVGWFHGTFDPDDSVLDGDRDLAARAIAVYDANGAEPPMPGTRGCVAKPSPDYCQGAD